VRTFSFKIEGHRVSNIGLQFVKSCALGDYGHIGVITRTVTETLSCWGRTALFGPNACLLPIPLVDCRSIAASASAASCPIADMMRTTSSCACYTLSCMINSTVEAVRYFTSGKTTRGESGVSPWVFWLGVFKTGDRYWNHGARAGSVPVRRFWSCPHLCSDSSGGHFL